MTRIALPLIPASFITLGLVLTIASLTIGMIPTQIPDTPDVNLLEAPPSAEVPALPYHIATQTTGYNQVILNRSPFSKDRGPFQEASITSEDTPKPSRTEVTLQLIGVTTEDSDHFALLIRNDTQSLNRYRIGDETPAGRILMINSNGVTIDAGNKEKHIRLYEELTMTSENNQ